SSLHWTAGPRQPHLHWKEMDPGRRRSRVVHSVLPRRCTESARLACELSWNRRVRLVCDGRHHAVSSYVFVILRETISKTLQGNEGVVQIRLRTLDAGCRPHLLDNG